MSEKIDDLHILFNADTPCLTCAWFRPETQVTCDAFPKRIPEEIASGENRHEQRFPGDGGKIYHPMKEI